MPPKTTLTTKLYKKVDPQTAKGLKVLRERIEESGIPGSQLDHSIIVGSWNIREFGKSARSPAAIHYIAEILSCFDLISVQELRGNLADLARVMENLGADYRVVFSDITEGQRGNDERIAYIYDRRAVTFTGLAAEVVVPPEKKTGSGVTPSEQIWRTPYIASFRSGSFDFVLISVHILWGSDPAAADRVTELARVADWVENRRLYKFVEDRDIILLGDFNIPKFGDKFYKAITKHGLESPKAVFDVPGGSNLDRDARYDQILFYPSSTQSALNKSQKGGVIDFYAKNHKPLFPDLDKTKFTYQLSDHLPLWLEVKTDTADEELDQILNPGN